MKTILVDLLSSFVPKGKEMVGESMFGVLCPKDRPNKDKRFG